MKRLLAALLPSGSREHVLGDLAQRGNRLRDIASVLPRVWWSHLRRSLFGPVPSLAGASEPELRRRCWRLEDWTLIGTATYFVLKCADAWLRHRSFGLKLFLATCLLALLGIAAVSYVRRKRTPHHPDGYWLRRYRALLSARTGWLGYNPILLALTVSQSWWNVPIVVATALWVHRRTRRASRELRALEAAE